jgi:osmoprotectant transport system permease protein
MKSKIIIILAVIIALCAYLIISRINFETTNLDIAFGAEFLTRPDGYEGLSEHYNFRFNSEPKQMVDGLLYKAVANGSVDVINGFSTDGRIPAYNLVSLKDDKNFFPPYYAAPLVRSQTLQQYPQLEKTLNLLTGKLSNRQMQQLNYQADEKGRKAADIAKDFLTTNGLIDPNQTKKQNHTATITVGSKEFSEQEILGQILVQLIEAKTNLKVNPMLNLGGTIICFNALKAGDIDLYPEYTGTGLVTILKQQVVTDPEKVYAIVKQKFKQQYNLIWLQPFGFNNTYTLTMRKKNSTKLNIKTISDLAQHVKSAK